MARLFGGRFLAAACVVGLILACFGPALSRGRQLAYRDFSDFYYPLYQRVQQEWDAGRLPLWSVEENGGSPMLGNPTSAVLYPGKLIYAALPYPWAAKVYVVAHVLLAFGAMVSLLRGWGVSPVGSALAGLAYAFGAPVLVQYANVVFLVGAAWMPLGFRFADGWIRLRRPRALAGLAVVLAMQVLGGDPEAAYLTAVAAGGYAVGRGVVGEPPGRRGRLALAGLGVLAAYGVMLGLEIANLPKTPRGWWSIRPSTAVLVAWSVAGVVVALRWWPRRGRMSPEGALLGLLLACGLAAALAGAQLVPILEFIGQTTRLGEGGFAVDIYTHSLHPARIVEWAWPDAFGPPFGVNRNWLMALPPTYDYMIWLTSLYLGGLTTVLAIGAMGFRSGTPGRGWLSVVAVVALLASFGGFGSPIFWARAAAGPKSSLGALEEPESGPTRPDGRLRDGDGGPYWFLASALPGFRSFRYPGKLMIPAALGMAGLAGMGFDGLVAGRRRVVSVLAWTLLAVGMAALLATAIAPDRLPRFLQGRAELARSVFGPFDAAGAAVALRWSIAQGAAMMALALVLVRVAPRRPWLAGVLALVGLSADLAWANRAHVGSIPQSAYDAEPTVLDVIRRAERERPEPGPFRVYRLRNWAPLAWNLESSPGRLEQIVRWERDTLRDKYGLPYRVASTFAYGTAEQADHAPFFQSWFIKPSPEVAQGLGMKPGQQLLYFPRRGFDLWNTRYFVLPTRLVLNSYHRGFVSFLDETELIYPDFGPIPETEEKRRDERWAREDDIQVFRNKLAYPRAWVVHRAIPVGPTGKLTPEARSKEMTALLYRADPFWKVENGVVADPRQVAWVEAEARDLVGLAGASTGSEPVRVIQGDDPTRVELEVTLKSPGLVVLADIFYPGWQLEIDGRLAESFRVNRAMRGAIAPAGPHRLVYTYRPTSLIVGTSLSVVGLVGLASLLAFGRSKSGAGRTQASDRDQ